jgi:hypothetical protein
MAILGWSAIDGASLAALAMLNNARTGRVSVP